MLLKFLDLSFVTSTPILIKQVIGTWGRVCFPGKNVSFTRTELELLLLHSCLVPTRCLQRDNPPRFPTEREREEGRLGQERLLLRGRSER